MQNNLQSTASQIKEQPLLQVNCPTIMSQQEITHQLLSIGRQAKGILKKNNPFSNSASSILEEARQFDSTQVRHITDDILTCIVPPARPHTNYCLPREEYIQLYHDFFGRKPTLPSNWTDTVPLHLVIFTMRSDAKLDAISWDTFTTLEKEIQEDIGSSWAKLIDDGMRFMDMIIEKKQWTSIAEVFIQAAVGNNDTHIGEYSDGNRGVATVKAQHLHIGIRTKPETQRDKTEQLFSFIKEENTIPRWQKSTIGFENSLFSEFNNNHINLANDTYTSMCVRALSRLWETELEHSLKELNIPSSPIHLRQHLPSSNLAQITLPHFSCELNMHDAAKESIHLASLYFVKLNRHWKELLTHLTHYFKIGRTEALREYIEHHNLSHNSAEALPTLLMSTPTKQMQAKGVISGSLITRFNDDPNFIPAGNAGFSMHISKTTTGTWKIEFVPSLTTRGPCEAKNIQLFEEKK